MVELTVQITRKVIHRELQLDREVIKEIVTSTLKSIEGEREVKIRLNPEDLELLENQKQELLSTNGGIREIDFVPDRSIELGGCIVETDFGGIDATVTSQLEEIETKLLEVKHNE